MHPPYNELFECPQPMNDRRPFCHPHGAITPAHSSCVRHKLQAASAAGTIESSIVSAERAFTEGLGAATGKVPTPHGRSVTRSRDEDGSRGFEDATTIGILHCGSRQSFLV